MHRTASHILSSPNSAQLEMRILANHGADPRFAFLRGRWARAWRLEKGRIRVQQEEEKRKKEEAEKGEVGLGGLTGYGDSDDDETEDEGAKALDDSAQAVRAQAESESASVAQDANNAVKEARRARAREWGAQRRAAAAGGTSSSSNRRRIATAELTLVSCRYPATGHHIIARFVIELDPISSRLFLYIDCD